MVLNDFFLFASENAWDYRGTEKESPIERISALIVFFDKLIVVGEGNLVTVVTDLSSLLDFLFLSLWNPKHFQMRMKKKSIQQLEMP